MQRQTEICLSKFVTVICLFAFLLILMLVNCMYVQNGGLIAVISRRSVTVPFINECTCVGKNLK